MNRRGFLKGLAAVCAAPIVAKIAPAIEGAEECTGLMRGEIGRWENVRFIETKEFGNTIAIGCRGMAVPELVKQAQKLLFMDARKTLPTGTRFVILDGGESDYGRMQHLAWYYSPKPLSNERLRNVVCEAIA